MAFYENSQTVAFNDATNNGADPYFAKTRKTFDPIHSFIVFDQDIWKFIDTPEFQRLRCIKQLGGVSYVFQGASHTRFEHSLGTGHLAQKQVKNIYKYHSSIVEELGSKEYTQSIKQNITLAGLLHDLGHALFSHLFDCKVIPKLMPESDWCHEKGSVMLFDHLVDKNNIDIDEEDGEMIKDLIMGKSDEAKYKDKRWIFDIVANKRNSIDVDKFDYMRRDSYHLGLKDTTFDYDSLMKEARVINDEICFPAKMCFKVYELFQARYKLYKNIYHNRASEAIELMITEILINADPYFKFHEAIGNPEEYVKLTDHVLSTIEHSTAPELEKSRQTLQRLLKRDTYKFAAETIIDCSLPLQNDERMKVDILSYAKNCGNTEEDLGLKDFEVSSGTNNFAFKDKNPVECVRFYNKNDINKSFFIDKDQVSLLLPSKYSEKFLRIFVKDSRKIERARTAFEEYCKKILHASTTPIESKTTPSKPRLLDPSDTHHPLEPKFTKKAFSSGKKS